MSRLRDLSKFLFMSTTGPKVAQRIQVVSILLHYAKLCWDYFAFIWIQLVEVVMSKSVVRSQACCNVGLIIQILHLQVPLLVQKCMGTFSYTKKMYGNVVPTPLHSGHVTSTICRDNSLGFTSLWLRFMIKACGQGVRSTFKLRGSVFRVRV